MRLTVIIPTTDGPVRIVKISRLARLPLSQVVTVDDFVPHPEMTQRYHALTDPAGPLRDLISLHDVRFELCLDKLPEMGRSWELPVAIAHWALDQGHELVSSGADLEVWATGMIKPGQEIAEQDYYLDEKLKSYLKANGGNGSDVPLILVLPRAEEPEVAAFQRKFETAKVVSAVGVSAAIAAVQQAITDKMPTPISLNAVPKSGLRGAGQNKKLWGTIVTGTIVCGGAIILVLSNGREAPGGLSANDSIEATPGSVPAANPAQTTDVAKLSTAHGQKESETKNDQRAAVTATGPKTQAIAVHSLTLVEHRARQGASCIDVLFDPRSAQRVVRESLSGRFPSSDVAGLCAISFKISDAPETIKLELPQEFLTRVLPSDRSGPKEISSNSILNYRLIDHPIPLNYSFSLVGADTGKVFRFSHDLVSD